MGSENDSQYINSLSEILEMVKNTDRRLISNDGRLVYYNTNDNEWYILTFPNYPGNPFNIAKIRDDLEKTRFNLNSQLSAFIFDLNAQNLNPSLVEAETEFNKLKDVYPQLDISGLSLKLRDQDFSVKKLSQSEIEQLSLDNRPRVRRSMRPMLPLSRTTVVAKTTVKSVAEPTDSKPITGVETTTAVKPEVKPEVNPVVKSTDSKPTMKLSVKINPLKVLAAKKLETSSIEKEKEKEKGKTIEDKDKTADKDIEEDKEKVANDKLFFYSKSAAKQRPGEGVNEYVSAENKDKYVKLSMEPDWRKKLSNFWIAPIKIDDKEWNTVEHYFQAKKLGLIDKEKADELSLDSGSEISKDDGSSARNQRKALPLTGKELQEWDRIKDEVMQKALMAKFTQHNDLQKILLETQDAELWHGSRGDNNRQYILEKVRSLIKQEVSKPVAISGKDSTKPIKPKILPKLFIKPTATSSTATSSTATATATATATSSTTTSTTDKDKDKDKDRKQAETFNKNECSKDPLTHEALYRKLLPGKELPGIKSLICGRIETELKRLQKEQKGGSEYELYTVSELSDVKENDSDTGKKPFDILTTVVDTAKYLADRDIPPEIKDTVISTIMSSETGKKLMPYMEKLKASPELQEQLFSLLKMAYNDIKGIPQQVDNVTQ